MARLTASSYVKITLIILLGFLILAIASFGTCSFSPWGFRGSTLSQIGNAEVHASAVKEIEIDWAAGSVDIKTHTDGDNIILTESGTGAIAKAQSMRWQLVGNTLRIDYGTWGWGSCMAYRGTKHLEVSIPRSLAQDLRSLDIDGASGNYSIDGIGCKSLKVSLASGSLNARDMTIGDLRLETASGGASVEGEISDGVKIDTASGNIDVVCRKVCPRSVDADMASGTVTVSIPENKGFTAVIDKVSGSFRSDFPTQQDGNAYVYKNGEAAIKVNIVSGQFILKKTS